MPYTNKLLNVGDLLAAWQNRGMREQADGSNYMNEKKRKGDMYEQAAMQQLAQEGLPVTPQTVREWSSGRLGPSVATATIKGPGYDSATGMGTRKVLLSDLPGYSSAVEPETMFREKAATDRAMIGAMGQSASAASGHGGPPAPTPEVPSAYQGGYAKGSPAMAQMVAEKTMQHELGLKQADIGAKMDVANIAARGRVDAAAEANKGKKDVANITTTGNVAEKDKRALQAERDDLYRAATDYGLDTNQLALIERNLPKLYEDAKANGVPIPWSVVMDMVLKGTFKDISK